MGCQKKTPWMPCATAEVWISTGQTRQGVKPQGYSLVKYMHTAAKYWYLNCGLIGWLMIGGQLANLTNQAVPVPGIMINTSLPDCIDF